MGRRTLNRRELRAANDAAERREDEPEVEEEAEEEEEEEAEAEDEGEEADAESGAETDEGDEEDDDDESRPKKKAKPKPKPKPKKPAKEPKPRKSRSAKIVRMKLTWGVFNNSNQRVASYEYPKKAEADAHAAKLTTDKKSTHFVQPVKEPMEEKKEKE